MRPLFLLALVAAAFALEDPAEHLAQMDRDHQLAKEAYVKAWLKAADLSPIPEPALEKDPRKSDADRAERIRVLNGQMLSLRAARGELLSYQEAARKETVAPSQWATVVEEAARLRGRAPAAEAVAKPPAKEHHEPTAVFVNRARPE